MIPITMARITIPIKNLNSARIVLALLGWRVVCGS
jgi:hypothetical protein